MAKRYRHSNWILSVAFSHDSSHVAFGSEDQTVQILNTATGQIEHKYKWNHNHLAIGSVAFSHDSSYVVCGFPDRTSLVWDVTRDEAIYSSLSRSLFSDGTQIYLLGHDQFHIYDPVDQEATIETLAYLLSITKNHHWILGEPTMHSGWIPPRYRNFTRASIGGSTVCLLCVVSLSLI
jgi:WD40 repeat protein